MSLLYHINKTSSEEKNGLVIDLYDGEATQPLSETQWKKRAQTKEDLQALAFLLRSPSPCRSVVIPFKDSLHALKLLAATGRLYFNQKQIVCDFFGKSTLYYVVDETKVITARVKTSLGDFDIGSCNYICRGPPAWFIKDISLKFFSEEVSWQELKAAMNGTVAYEDIQNSPNLAYIGNAKEIIRQSQGPLPILKLKDRTGAFADLWMDYGSGRQFSIHDLQRRDFRDLASESLWEKDLFETDFIKKNVGSSQYYCPLDKVAKSLGFLLELGWKIEDWRGNRLVKAGTVDCRLEQIGERIHLKGKIDFDTFEVDVSTVAGAFNRKELFLQIAPQTTALLSMDDKSLQHFLEEGELVGDTVSVKRQHVGLLTDLHVKMDGDLKEKLLSAKQICLSPPGNLFQGSLRPYQQEGVNWLSFLYESGFHGILADDMGLGKTVQVLAFLSRLEAARPILIVLPTSLLFNWRKEIELFLPSFSIIAYHGQERTSHAAALQKYQIVLTSYATLRLDLPLLSKLEWECVILDEAQAIKNAHTQTAQAVCKLKARFRLSLTGTPIENHLNELWSHFHFIMPELFEDEADFEREVSAGQSDSRYIHKIKRKIRPFILRRKKEEVAKDLPEKVEQVVWIELPAAQRQAYDEFLSGVRNNLMKKVRADGTSKHRMEILEAILRLRQICCHPALASLEVFESGKLNTLLQDIDTVVDEGRKVLVYSQFTSMLQLISKELRSRGYDFAYLDGSTVDREKVVTQFQEDPAIKVFLISLKAGGTGLNLTAADYVFLYDPWWNEAAENQAIDRVHRIGRKNTVFAKRYVTIETIEEKMMSLKANKKKTIGEIFDGDWEASSISLEDLSSLLD